MVLGWFYLGVFRDALNISTLQFLAEDWLLPSPKLGKILNSNKKVSSDLKNELTKLMKCSINYEYLTNTDKYSKILRFFIIDKAKLSIWFLTLLEYSLKHERILYSKAFSTLNFLDTLDNDFFMKKKENIINNATDHILKNYYAKNNKYINDRENLEKFLELCNNKVNIDSINKYFQTVYTNKILFECNNA